MLRISLVILVFTLSSVARTIDTAVLISADAEWRVVKPMYPNAALERSPFGEFFTNGRVLFFQGGWGKVAAAGSTQYVIDRFRPRRLINLGTCGGVEGRIRRFEVVAPVKIVVYDIVEGMGDSQESLDHYTTALQVPEPTPFPVVKTTLHSADRDLTPGVLREIEPRFHPVAADWESGAIAWVAARNGIPLLVLRGVSDLVSTTRGEAEGNAALFETNARRVMEGLVRDLPEWLRYCERNAPLGSMRVARRAGR